MPSIIAAFTLSAAVVTEVDLDIHVHKRTERFVYRDTICATDVPISYLENELVAPRKLVSVVASENLGYDFSLGLPELETFTGNVFNTRASVIEATNKFITDVNGAREPLWYKHKLQPGAQAVTIRKTSSGQVPEYTGLQIAMEENAVYTNFRNYFNPDTGAWLIYWLDIEYQDGSETVMLAPVPIVSPGTWQDIDPDTGMYGVGVNVYDREVSGIGYEYVFNVIDTYWVRYAKDAALTAKPPCDQSNEQSWFLQITAGDVLFEDNRYRVTEWGSQPFYPAAPYRKVSRSKVTWVNERTAYLGRRGVDLTVMPLFIYVYESDGSLIEAYTTDESSADSFYEGVIVQYLSNAGVDSDSGLVWTSIGFRPNRSYYMDYGYAAVDYEFESLELNPLLNPAVKDGSYIVYCLPNLGDGETSIHWMYLKNGKILATSQGPGGTYDNLQLTTEAGDYNTDTIINMSLNEAHSVLSDLSYYRICIVGLKNIPVVSDVFDVDVRRSGPKLVDNESFVYNSLALYTDLGYGHLGQSVPGPGAVIVDVPLDLLEAYGGLLNETQVRIELERFLSANTYLVINWIYPKPNVIIQTETTGAVNVTAEYAGDGEYKFLRRDSKTDTWTELDSIDVSTYVDTEFEDITCLSGRKYYYAVQVNDYPVGNEIRVEVI